VGPAALEWSLESGVWSLESAKVESLFLAAQTGFLELHLPACAIIVDLVKP